jgi:hypothetical protein
VRLIDHKSQGGRSESDIAEGLSAHCRRLDQQRLNICSTIIPDHIPRILELLRDRKRPDFICEVLGYARGFGSGRLISKDSCVRIVDVIRTEPGKDSVDRVLLKKPKLLEEPPPRRAERRELRERALPEHDNRPFGLRRRDDAGHEKMGAGRHFGRGPEACQKMENDEKMMCMVLSRLVLRGMRDELGAGMSSEEICKKLEERHLISLTDVDTMADVVRDVVLRDPKRPLVIRKEPRQ